MKTVFVQLSLLGLLSACLAAPTVNQAIFNLVKSNSTLLQYPTQFTQNIVPKQIHSHNDYWRDVPVLTALSLGVGSIEADVWLINGTLHIGHELQALTSERTLDSLYIQPLLSIVQGENPVTQFTPAANVTIPNSPWDMSGGTPLQLLIDVKTDGVAALPFILDALQPLREGQFLTTFDDGILVTSAITVIGTGNSPLAQIETLSPRDFFFDAPLAQLTNTSLNANWSVNLSPIASVDYESVVSWKGIGTISDDDRSTITKLVGDAHARGIKARFWDTPGWPVNAREAVWQELINDGSDWLNADDLLAASSF